MRELIDCVDGRADNHGKRPKCINDFANSLPFPLSSLGIGDTTMLCNAFNANLSLPGLRLLSRTIECKAIQNTTQSWCLPQEASFWTPERLAQHDSCVIDASKSLYDNSNAPLASTVRRPVALLAASCILTYLPLGVPTHFVDHTASLSLLRRHTSSVCMPLMQ